jgi:peroxiredoxin
LRDHEEEIRAAGAGIVAIGLGDPRYARAFREETGIGFPLLVDEERKAYRAADLSSATVLHLLRKDNAKARARAKRQGHQQHALGKNPFQLGASFVFEPGNRDAYVHRAETFGDNAPVEELIAALTVHDENDDTA